MRITSKGQVTIPQAIREKLGLLPETDVEFEIDGNAVRIRKAGANRRGEAIVKQMRGRASRKLTTDQIMALTRGSSGSRKRG
jgi:AbrB family looped-hinge helix DNA binding protein